MYAESVVKNAQAQGSNIGAMTNAIGNTALTIGGAIAGVVGGSMAQSGIAMGGTKGLAKAQMGQGIQKLGFQMVGRQIGGFSGIVIGSGIQSAYEDATYGQELRELSKSVAFDTNVQMKDNKKDLTNMKMEQLKKMQKGGAQALNEVKRRKKEESKKKEEEENE